MYTLTSKYQVVADRIAGMTGTLVDIGARDRVLQQYIRANELQYLSSDVVSGHDYCWDLEKPIEASDNAFDIVVALDVLEHVEHIHAALRELVRIARNKLFISLPNLTCLSFRLHFLRYGQLSGKYSLLPEYQGDRHRWLTSYPQVCALVQRISRAVPCDIQQYNILLGYGRWQDLFSRLPLPASLRTYAVLFELTKPIT